MSYGFQAEPQVVARGGYRPLSFEVRTRKEDPSKSNIMFDRRVIRGNTYAPRVAPSSVQLDATQARTKRRIVRPRKQVEDPFPDIPAPPPVPGRLHMYMQTDEFLEDLRVQPNSKQSRPTQTDPEMDRPTKPLFNPKSSGDDKFTWIDDGDLFDFQLNAEPILEVLCAKSLDQAMMEVLEEEELKEVELHRLDFQQQRNAAMAEVQSMEARFLRRDQENSNRLDQEQRVIREKATENEARYAAKVAKQAFDDLGDTAFAKVEAAGHFYDPIEKQVTQKFMPWVVDETAEKLDEKEAAYLLTDALINRASEAIKLESSQGERENLLEARLQGLLRDDAKYPGILLKSKSFKQTRDKLKEAAAMSVGGITQTIDRKQLAMNAAIAGLDSVSSEGMFMHTTANEVALEAKREDVQEAMERYDDYVRIQSRMRGRRARLLVAKKKQKMLRDQELARLMMEEERRRNETPLDRFKTIKCNLGFVGDSSPQGGVRVEWVDPIGGAVHASLIEGDRVTKVGSHRVSTMTEMDAICENLMAGDLVEVTVERFLDGRRQMLKIETSAESKSMRNVRQMRRELNLPTNTDRLYDMTSALLTVASLTKIPGFQAKKKSSTPRQGGSKGVLVGKVSKKSGARFANITSGCAILSIDGKAINTPEEFETALAIYKAGDLLELEVEQMDGTVSSESLELYSKEEKQEWVRSLRLMAGMDVYGRKPSMEDIERISNPHNDDDTPETKAPATPAEQALEDLKAIVPGLDLTTYGDNDKTRSVRGVQVKGLERFGVATHASIVSDDVILEFDDTTIKSPNELQVLLDHRTAGDPIQILLNRSIDGREDLCTVELCDASGVHSIAEIRALREKANLPVHKGPRHTKLSAQALLKDIRPAVSFSLVDVEWSEDTPGPQISTVQSESVAERAGLSMGGMIVRVGSKVVESVSDFESELKKATAGDLLELGLHNESTVSIEIEGEGRRNTLEWIRSLRIMAGYDAVNQNTVQSKVVHDIDELDLKSDSKDSKQESKRHDQVSEYDDDALQMMDDKNRQEALEELQRYAPSIGATVRAVASRDPSSTGVVVTKSASSGMLVQASVVPGDLLLKVDDRNVMSSSELKEIIAQKQPGDLVPFDVKRGLDGRREVVFVEIGTSADKTQDDIRRLRGIAGLTVETSTIHDPSSSLEALKTMNPVLGFKMIPTSGDDELLGALVVSAVKKDSAADLGGIKVRDVLLQLEGQEVTSQEEFLVGVNKLLPGQPTRLVVCRYLEENKSKPVERQLNIEIGAQSHDNPTIEDIRALRIIAGLKVSRHVGASKLPLPRKIPDSSSMDNAAKEALIKLEGMKPSLGMSLTLNSSGSLVVESLVPFESAIHGALVLGDQIKEFEGAEITSVEEFDRQLTRTFPGERVHLSVIRAFDGRDDEVVLEVGALGQGNSLSTIRELRKQAGLDVENEVLLTDSKQALVTLKAFKPRVGFEVSDGPGAGIQVNRVIPGGPAERAGIKDDDFLMKVRSIATDDRSEFSSVLRNSLVGDVVKIEISRGERGVDADSLELFMEIGARGEREDTVEWVRSLRRMAGLEVAEEK